ncbi:hypothetical protein SAMD00079811_11020 [Scytonema sp. HK-05]|nr:hypothetical protein SAMD00079811_11020 [Scytonema sp. HK-05]
MDSCEMFLLGNRIELEAEPQKIHFQAVAWERGECSSIYRQI